MNLLIIEPEASGHHMVLYFRNIAKEAIRRNWRLHLITTSKAITHRAYLEIETEIREQLGITIIPQVKAPIGTPTRLNLIRYQVERYRTFARGYRDSLTQFKPDTIYLINMDECDKIMSLLGSPFGQTPYSGMLMSLNFHHPKIGVSSQKKSTSWLESRLFSRLLALPNLRAITTIDETLPLFAEQIELPNRSKIRYTPDVAAISRNMTREQARLNLGICQNQIVILIYGFLSFRKGIVELLTSISSCETNKNVVVLLAGQQDKQVEYFLKQEIALKLHLEQRLLEFKEFLNDEEEQKIFAASDIVWVCYRNFSSMSGVLIQAGAMGLPVIANQEGLVGWTTQRYQLGRIVDISKQDEIIAAINSLVNNLEQRHDLGNNGRYFASSHTPQHFSKAICNAIAS